MMKRKVVRNDLTKEQLKYDLVGALEYYQSLGFDNEKAYELVSINLELKTVKY